MGSRKRGITENDLLLGTFADKYLSDFTMDELLAYDRIINATTYDPTFTEGQEYPPELVKDHSMTAEYASDPIPGVAEMMTRIIEHSKNKDMRILLQPELNKNIV